MDKLKLEIADIDDVIVSDEHTVDGAPDAHEVHDYGTPEKDSDVLDGEAIDTKAAQPRLRRSTRMRRPSDERSEQNDDFVSNSGHEGSEDGDPVYLDIATKYCCSQSENGDIVLKIDDLKNVPVAELLSAADLMGVNDCSGMVQDLVFSITKKLCMKLGFRVKVQTSGILEVLHDGFGFIRSPRDNFATGPDDVYVSPNQIRKLNLRKGDSVSGELRPPRKGERYFALLKAFEVNGIPTESKKNTPGFDTLVALYPDEKINLEVEINDTSFQTDVSTRVMDIITPLGKGQRALIVAPPRTGKTVLLKNIAQAIATNHPEIQLMVLLIDERPEEVTDMERSIRGQVISSTFDEPPSRHTQVADLAIEQAKRAVESGKDVVILLDSITRLARAYNTVAPSSGRVLTGGVDSNALQRPKRLFGAARNIEGGGSLTIIGTALVDTGSRMDEVIFEEFKGTGNAEIILDRKLSDKRIFPSIDVLKSGTRKEELLVKKDILTKSWILKNILLGMNQCEAMDFLLTKVRNSKNNADFFDNMNTSACR